MLKHSTPLYRIYYKLNQKVYECYGFKTKNNLIALYVEQGLKKLIGTIQEQHCELFEQIGKVKEQFVMPSPITLKKLSEAKCLTDEDEQFQMKLF